MLSWLEPTIEVNCDIIANELLNATDNKNLYKNLLEIIRNNNFADDSDAFNIENIFLVCIKNSVELAYRKGIKDGIHIYRDIE